MVSATDTEKGLPEKRPGYAPPNTSTADEDGEDRATLRQHFTTDWLLWGVLVALWMYFLFEPLVSSLFETISDFSSSRLGDTSTHAELADWGKWRCPHGGKTLAPSNYTVVKGLFRQDEDDFDGHGYDLLKDGFGLLDKSADRWHNFTRHIAALNRHADRYTTYKVIWVARHGEGYHNVAERQYGTAAWDCHWSMLNGDGNLTWGPDPILTPLGEEQARWANEGWKEQMVDGVPLPQSLYSSPLRRAARTLDITWSDILLNRKFHRVRPIIKENLREMTGLHTCDLRSSKSLLAETFPGFVFEPSFTEHDILWDATYQETGSQEAVRLRMALNEIFATDPRTFIGITAHGGVIGALFRAVGKKDFPVLTGGFVPFVLKATSHPSATFEPIVRGQSATAPACVVDPTAPVATPAATAA